MSCCLGSWLMMANKVLVYGLKPFIGLLVICSAWRNSLMLLQLYISGLCYDIITNDTAWIKWMEPGCCDLRMNYVQRKKWKIKLYEMKRKIDKDREKENNEEK